MAKLDKTYLAMAVVLFKTAMEVLINPTHLPPDDSHKAWPAFPFKSGSLNFLTSSIRLRLARRSTGSQLPQSIS